MSYMYADYTVCNIAYLHILYIKIRYYVMCCIRGFELEWYLNSFGNHSIGTRGTEAKLDKRKNI